MVDGEYRRQRPVSSIYPHNANMDDDQYDEYV